MSWRITPSFTQWTPALISTALWLDAADATTMFDATSGGSLVAPDGTVARWQDKSGNANHATQSTSGDRPLRKTNIQNGRDILRFDGSNDSLAGMSTPCATDAKTIIAVTKNSNAVGGTVFQNRKPIISLAAFITRTLRTGGISFVAGDTTTTNTTISPDLSTAWQSFNLSSWTQQSSNRSVFYWNNGTSYATTGIPLSEAAPSGYNIGASGTSAGLIQHFPGDMCELIILNSEASTDTRQRIEGYLAHKWGLGANLPNDHPYKVNPPAP